MPLDIPKAAVATKPWNSTARACSQAHQYTKESERWIDMPAARVAVWLAGVQ